MLQLLHSSSRRQLNGPVSSHHHLHDPGAHLPEDPRCTELRTSMHRAVTMITRTIELLLPTLSDLPTLQYVLRTYWTLYFFFYSICGLLLPSLTP